MSKVAMKKTSRGRPLKFGRPSQVVAVTLPTDTIDQLHRIDPDLGKAIVAAANIARPGAPLCGERPAVDFEKVGRRKSLIVVDRGVFREVPRCDLIPISDQRAFLALEDGVGVPELELAVADRLAESRLPQDERRGLESLRDALRTCRRSRNVEVESRSILVVEESNRPR